MYKRAVSWFTLGMMLLVLATGSLILTNVGIAQEKVTVLVGGGHHLLSPRRAATRFWEGCMKRAKYQMLWPREKKKGLRFCNKNN